MRSQQIISGPLGVKKHLVQSFLEPVEDAPKAPTLHYDEGRSLTIADNGIPIVDLGISGDTVTQSEVAGEQEDRDEDDDLKTVTMVAGEGFDHSRASDYRAWLGTVTVTKAVGESEDSDDLEGAERPPRRTWFQSWAGTVTSTRISMEVDDID